MAAAVAATASGSPDYGLDAPRIVRRMFSRAAWTLGVALVIYFINRAEYPGPAARMCGVLALIGLGVWLSLAARRTDLRATLVSRRDALLSKLEELELKRRNGKMADERYLTRRQRLISELEDVYHEIDLAGGRSQGGDEGVAA